MGKEGRFLRMIYTTPTQASRTPKRIKAHSDKVGIDPLGIVEQLMVTVLFSREIAPAVESPLPRSVEVPNKWTAPFASIVPLKTEPLARSNSPFICQYTLHRDAELIRLTFARVLVAKAPLTWKINKEFGSFWPSKT